jgi:hypothetical protein
VAYTRADLTIFNHKERIAAKPKPKMKQNGKPIIISKVSEPSTSFLPRAARGRMKEGDLQTLEALRG